MILAMLTLSSLGLRDLRYTAFAMVEAHETSCNGPKDDLEIFRTILDSFRIPASRISYHDLSDVLLLSLVPFQPPILPWRLPNRNGPWLWLAVEAGLVVRVGEFAS